jgi:hypothetical protein
MATRWNLAILTLVLCAQPTRAADVAVPARAEVAAALIRAATSFHDHCEKHGGYDWRYSRDFQLTEGEDETDSQTVWVQPPGTPAVGMAMLDIYRATGDERCLRWGIDAARALALGQMQSGGWYYSITFDPHRRKRYGYRDNKEFDFDPGRRNKRNLTTLDDDTTCAALRCVMRADSILHFEDPVLHDAAQYCLAAMVMAQYPNGGWSQSWDRFPKSAPSEKDFPIARASYPEQWSRKWLNDWPGRYYTNDNVTGNMITTLLKAFEVYHDQRYLEAARRTGEFLIHAQMPAPQSGWAQQYDPQMHPCWDRKFEPPALASDESQEVISALLELYRATGEARFLEPVPQGLDWLRRSLLPDGQLARFYELKTNRPLFFTKKYQLTEDASDLPTHYAFLIPSRIPELERDYEQLKSQGRPQPQTPTSSQPAPDRVVRILNELDASGLWVSPRGMKSFSKASPQGVIESEIFIRNADVLARWLQALPK